MIDLFIMNAKKIFEIKIENIIYNICDEYKKIFCRNIIHIISLN